MGKKKKQEQQEPVQLPDHDVAPKRHRADPSYEVLPTEVAPKGKKEKKPKLSKKERKELKKQQAENEKRLVAEGVISPRVRYAPRSFLWNILAVCLAFFLGIFFVIGAVVFAGAKSSIKSILGLVGVEYANLVTEEYAEKSLIDLFHDLTTTEFTNLNSLGKYTPLLGNTINGLNEQLGALGVHLNVDELMQVDFGEIGAYFQENVVQTIRLGETLGLTPDSSPLMIAICYGTEGEDFDVVDGAFQMKNGKHATTISDLTEDATGLITRVTVEAALNTNANSPAAMRFLAYGSEGETYDIVDGEIVMRTNTATGEKFPKKTLSSITEEGSDVIGDAKLGDLMDMSDANNFMATIKDWHISDLQNANRINRLKISQIINTEGSTSLMMNAIKDWRIGDLTKQGNIDSLYIGDVLTITGDSPKILRSLKDATLGNFGDAVNDVRLGDLLDDNLENNKFLRPLQKSTLATLASDINALTVADLFGEEIYAYSSLEQIQGYRGVQGETFQNYEEFIEYYEGTGRKDKTFSQNRPDKVTLTKNGLTSVRVPQGSTNKADALVAGWFQQSGNDAFTFVPNATDADVHIEKANDAVLYYVEQKPVVTPVYTWKKVDYDTSEENWETVTVSERSGDYYCNFNGTDYLIAENDFGYYITAPLPSGATGRIDLDRTISGYLQDGTPLPDGTAVRYQKPTETDDGYYYAVLRTYVTERYFSESDPSRSYTIEETAVLYEGTYTVGTDTTQHSGALVRYLDGIWYLLLSDSGADTPITRLSEEITRASEILDTTTLWELYVHNLINVNMCKDLGTGSNLNEKTLADALRMIADTSINS